MQSHRNLLHNARKLADGLAIRADDRLTLLSSPSFGASVSDIYGALLIGAAVCPYSLAGDGLRRLPEFLTREGITIYHSVPSVFRCFSSTLDGREDLSTLRCVKLGGEPVLASDFDLYRNRFPRRCVFHVGLGATEMNVIRQWFADHDTPWPGASPLGHAVDETEVACSTRTGPGAGRGRDRRRRRTLAVGYWKDPELTPRRFFRFRAARRRASTGRATRAPAARRLPAPLSAAGTRGSRSAGTASRPGRSKPRCSRCPGCARRRSRAAGDRPGASDSWRGWCAMPGRPRTIGALRPRSRGAAGLHGSRRRSSSSMRCRAPRRERSTAGRCRSPAGGAAPLGRRASRAGAGRGGEGRGRRSRACSVSTRRRRRRLLRARRRFALGGRAARLPFRGARRRAVRDGPARGADTRRVGLAGGRAGPLGPRRPGAISAEAPGSGLRRARRRGRRRGSLCRRGGSRA